MVFGGVCFTRFSVLTIFSRNERVSAGPLCRFNYLSFMCNLILEILVAHETRIGGHVLDGLESRHN